MHMNLLSGQVDLADENGQILHLRDKGNEYASKFLNVRGNFLLVNVESKLFIN